MKGELPDGHSDHWQNGEIRRIHLPQLDKRGMTLDELLLDDEMLYFWNRYSTRVEAINSTSEPPEFT